MKGASPNRFLDEKTMRGASPSSFFRCRRGRSAASGSHLECRGLETKLHLLRFHRRVFRIFGEVIGLGDALWAWNGAWAWLANGLPLAALFGAMQSSKAYAMNDFLGLGVLAVAGLASRHASIIQLIGGADLSNLRQQVGQEICAVGDSFQRQLHSLFSSSIKSG